MWSMYYVNIYILYWLTVLNPIDCDFFGSPDAVCCRKPPESQHVTPTAGRGNREPEERSEMCTTTDSFDNCAGLHFAPHRFQATGKSTCEECSWRNQLLIEGSLEVKLPTIWTDGKAKVGRVREEKRRREKIREEKELEERRSRRARR